MATSQRSQADLTDRVAVVTGAASGIGAALVRQFVAAGMRVVASDVDLPALERSLDHGAADIDVIDERMVAVAADVSRPPDVHALASATLAAFGRIDVVCANAGVVRAGGVLELTDEEWRWVIDVDLWGVVHVIRAFLPHLESAAGGHLVATSSTSGLSAPPFIAPYAAAKAGVIGIMESVRRELSERGSPVHVSVLCPGPVSTDLIASSSRLGDLRAPAPRTADGTAFDARTGAMLADAGISPDEVARFVIEALYTDRFWILTHPEWGQVLRRRLDAMLHDGSLTDRPAAPPSPRP